MAGGETPDKDVTLLGAFAGKIFLNLEILAYIVLGLLLVVAAVMGIGSAAMSMWAVWRNGVDGPSLVLAIDRLLFVLMIVEVLNTVRVSFRAGKLAAEPFLIVGLIASIRRVLVITLESSQVAAKPGEWTPHIEAQLFSHLQELVVLGGLILVMVVSIWLIRQSEGARK
jgi:uncharacterized membrane protein (DUF373 family)